MPPTETQSLQAIPVLRKPLPQSIDVVFSNLPSRPFPPELHYPFSAPARQDRRLPNTLPWPTCINCSQGLLHSSKASLNQADNLVRTYNSSIQPSLPSSLILTTLYPDTRHELECGSEYTEIKADHSKVLEEGAWKYGHCLSRL